MKKYENTLEDYLVHKSNSREQELEQKIKVRKSKEVKKEINKIKKEQKIEAEEEFDKINNVYQIRIGHLVAGWGICLYLVGLVRISFNKLSATDEVCFLILTVFTILCVCLITRDSIDYIIKKRKYRRKCRKVRKNIQKIV